MQTRTQKTIAIGMGAVALLSATVPALAIGLPPAHFIRSDVALNYFSMFIFLIIPVLALILSMRVIFSTDEVETGRLFRLCNYLWVPLFLNPFAFIIWIIWRIGRMGG